MTSLSKKRTKSPGRLSGRLNRFTAAALICTTTVLGSAQVVQAQQDETEYVRGLKQWGMVDVLEKYAQDSIAKENNSPNTVVWRTELGMLHLDKLTFSTPLSYTGDFFLYGMCTEGQIELVGNEGSAALAELATAVRLWSRLKARMPRQRDFKNKWGITGRWKNIDRMYGGLLLPYNHAKAAMFVALAGPSSPYMIAKAEGNENFDAAKERDRMLKSAASSLQGVIKNLEQLDYPTRIGIYATYAMLLSHSGDNGQALQTINTAIALKDNPAVGDNVKASSSWRYQMVMATLAKSVILQRSGSYDSAISEVENLLSKNPRNLSSPIGAGNDVLYALIAAGRIGAAYSAKNEGGKVYDGFDLVANDSRWSNFKESIDTMRYNMQVPGGGVIDEEENPKTRPDVDPTRVYIFAKRDMNNALRANREEKTEEAAALFVKAGEGFKKALDGGLKDPQKKDAMFQYAYCIWAQKKALEASKAFLAFSKDYPPQNENPRSQEMEALNATLKFAYDVYEQTYLNMGPATRNPASIAYFIEVVETIDGTPELAKWGVLEPFTLQIAEAYREQKEMEKALAWFQRGEKAGTETGFYLDCLYGVLSIKYDMWKNSVGVQRRTFRSEILAGGEKLVKGAKESYPTETDATKKANLAHYEGLTQLTMADVLVSNDNVTNGEAERALNILDTVEADARFASDDSMMLEVVNLKIASLQVLGRFSDITAEVEKIEKKDPANSGALLIPVLEAVESKIDQMERTGSKDRARALGQVALNMSDKVIAWAKSQAAARGEKFEGKESLYYDMMRAKALTSAGKYPEAIDFLNALQKVHGDQLFLVELLARTYWRIGGDENEIKASENYTQIVVSLEGNYGKLINELAAKQKLVQEIASIPLEDRTQDQRKELKERERAAKLVFDQLRMFWEANLAILQLLEADLKPNETKKEIAQRARVLRTRYDENFGSAYAPAAALEFGKLEVKHSN